jgi:hypothetical protein
MHQSDIAANTAKTGITSSQANAITANTAKVGMTLGTSSIDALAGDTTTISSGQASAIIANTAKTGITSGQISAVDEAAVFKACVAEVYDGTLFFDDIGLRLIFNHLKACGDAYNCAMNRRMDRIVARP